MSLDLVVIENADGRDPKILWGDTTMRSAMPAEILAAVRDLGLLVVRGVTCETCGGTGIVYAYDTEDGPAGPSGDCPTCKGRGLVPSPEAIEAAVMAAFPYEWEDGKRALPRNAGRGGSYGCCRYGGNMMSDYTAEELQEVADVWDDILLDFDQQKKRHYLGLTIPHPAAPRVMLTVRRIVAAALTRDTQ